MIVSHLSVTIVSQHITLVLYGSVVFTAEGIKSCKLLYDSKSDWKVLSRLEPLANKNFTVETMEQGESYTYVFQLCGDAGGVPGAGVVQVDKGTEKKTTVIGVYNATQAIGANDWVMLIYRNGDAYNAHCSKEKRKAFVMISCNRKDGCDFVCRSGNREESPAYRGVPSESLEEEPEERDDHLLPM
uniref:MRH domain-containing protein n=1 Tax=Scophthalmus maximus TaxID=52904 RepID=A0A8D3BUA2_SCOMX